MLQDDLQNNSIVILSDDDEEEQAPKEEKFFINEHGKRVYYYDENEEDFDEEGEEFYEGAEFDGEEEQTADDEDQDIRKEKTKWDDVAISQTLPEDHESPIAEERNQENPLKEINDIFNSLKSDCIKYELDQDNFITSFAFGTFVKDDAPNTAMNIEGVVGPVTFPLSDKDAKRITDAHPSKKGSCFEIETSKTLLNLSCQEYIFETIFPDILSHLGVNKTVAKNSRLEANRFYICKEKENVELPREKPKGSYGSAIIVLPSEYEGGQFAAKYNKQEKIFNPRYEQSESKCYYMAWYDDVEINSLAIEFGNRAFIHLSLIHNNDNESVNCTTLQHERLARENGELLPVEASKSESYLDQISSSLKSLLSKDDKYPIFYILNYSYAGEDFKVNNLEKSDKVMAKLMMKVAKKIECSTCIGCFDREVKAKVKNESDQGSDENTNSTSVEDCPFDEEGVYLTQSVISDTLTLTELHDAEGEELLENNFSLDLINHQPFIQGKSWFSRRKPDYQKYLSDEAAVKYLYFTNTAIVFSPAKWEPIQQQE